MQGNSTVARPGPAADARAGGGTTVELDGVAVRFRTRKVDVTALRDVSLRVAPGEFVAIVGPSGCGKSTLLKLVSGLLRPSGGQVRLLGEDVRGPRRDVGYVFQRAALLEWPTGRPT